MTPLDTDKPFGLAGVFLQTDSPHGPVVIVEETCRADYVVRPMAR